jgi:hypothetical protein
MFCHQCGSGVSDDAVTCPSCGADLRAKHEDLGATQPIPAPDATIRMAPAPSAPTAGAEMAATVILPPTGMAAAAPKPKAPPAAAAPSKNSGPLVLLFGAAVLLGIAGWGGYQWFLQHRGGAADTTPAAAAPPATPAPAADATPAPPPPAPAPDASAPAATPAPAPTATEAAPVTSGITPAQLAAARKERDAAVSQRDAALDQVKQLKDDLARAKAAPAVVTPAPPSGADAAKTSQLQKEHDTLRFVVGSRKQLLNHKVIESHLYLLPPPSTVTSINLTQSTEISFDAKTYGVNNPKDVVVIPSSVWENTDYRFAISGSTVKFTILRPDSFRTFAKYFVLMLE